MACVKWLNGDMTGGYGYVVAGNELAKAIERGEVLPAARAKKGAKRT